MPEIKVKPFGDGGFKIEVGNILIECKTREPDDIKRVAELAVREVAGFSEFDVILAAYKALEKTSEEA